MLRVFALETLVGARPVVLCGMVSFITFCTWTSLRSASSIRWLVAGRFFPELSPLCPSSELKTKPTQHSVRELRALGLTPHLLACRSAQPLLDNTKDKLSQFCHVPSQNAHYAILKQLNLLSVASAPDLQEWTNRAENYDGLTDSVRIAMVGKYVGLTDSYLSVVKALLHACIACSLRPSIDWIAASDLEDESAKLRDSRSDKSESVLFLMIRLNFNLLSEDTIFVSKSDTPEAHSSAWETLKNAECVLVPGGFGDRGVKGMILAAKYARENKIPYLGICLGMQISVIEFARSVLGWEAANSTEFESGTPKPVVIFMPEGSRTHMGSTMRLGSRRTLLQTPHCVTGKLYQNQQHVDERHRHRYEVNPDVVGALEGAGLRFVGKDETGKRMEILELPSHPFYVGVQFHPEFKSRPGRASALFLGLILSAKGKLEAYLDSCRNGD
ncbi:CTP synthase-like protein [Drosera capensis]